jgi:hypothetical protein
MVDDFDCGLVAIDDASGPVFGAFQYCVEDCALEIVLVASVGCPVISSSSATLPALHSDRYLAAGECCPLAPPMAPQSLAAVSAARLDLRQLLRAL